MNAPNYPIKNVLEARARLGEGPVWDYQRQCIYWVDIYNHQVNQFIPSTGQTQNFKVGEVVSCVAPAQSNRLIIALRHDIAYLDTITGEVQRIRTVERDKPNNRFNDGKCDPQGRFWFGSMSRSLEKGEGALYRYDPDGSLHIMQRGITLSNGIGWSPDQKTFYHTDTPLKTIYAYNYDPSTGNIMNRRVFVDLSNASSYPDGLTVDVEGCIWSAQWDGWCIIRFASDGREIFRVSLPVKRPTSCVFGGKEGNLLYVTTASVGLSEPEIEESFYSGDLFCIQTDVVGLPSYRFGG
jgi:sugar lactone lactonase YvrE